MRTPAAIPESPAFDALEPRNRCFEVEPVYVDRGFGLSAESTARQVLGAGPNTGRGNARAGLAMHSYENDVAEEIWDSHEEVARMVGGVYVMGVLH